MWNLKLSRDDWKVCKGCIKMKGGLFIHLSSINSVLSRKWTVSRESDVRGRVELVVFHRQSEFAVQ